MFFTNHLWFHKSSLISQIISDLTNHLWSHKSSLISQIISDLTNHLWSHKSSLNINHLWTSIISEHQSSLISQIISEHQSSLISEIISEHQSTHQWLMFYSTSNSTLYFIEPNRSDKFDVNSNRLVLSVISNPDTANRRYYSTLLLLRFVKISNISRSVTQVKMHPPPVAWDGVDLSLAVAPPPVCFHQTKNFSMIGSSCKHCIRDWNKLYDRLYYCTYKE